MAKKYFSIIIITLLRHFTILDQENAQDTSTLCTVTPPPRGESHIKITGMLVVSFRGINNGVRYLFRDTNEVVGVNSKGNNN